MPEAHRDRKFFYEFQGMAQVSESPPVQNTWYTLFDEEDVILYLWFLVQRNDDTAAKNVEIRATIDGIPLLGTTNAAENQDYWLVEDDSLRNQLDIETSVKMFEWYSPVHGQAVKLEVRITDAPGTNQLLLCRAKWGRWLET